MAELGVAHDDMVHVSSRRGEITLKVRRSIKVQKGTVFIPFHFREAAANALTTDKLDPYGKIPEFQSANKSWLAEAKDPDFKQALVAGKAYAKIFTDVDKLNVRWATARAKDKKISGRNGRAKAEARTKAIYHGKLKTQASKLQKLAKRYPDTYYGRAASKSLELYEKSRGESLTDQRQK